MFLRLTTFVFVIIVCIILISQIIYPAFFSKQYFWLFKKSQKKLCEQNNILVELGETKKIIDKQKEINKLRATIIKDLKKNTGNKQPLEITFENNIPLSDDSDEK